MSEKKYECYTFHNDDYEQHLEGRFWNSRGKHIAVVACITKGIDWAAYIGTDALNSSSFDGTLKHVAKYGCKLSERDARHFFPDIELTYRD